MPRLEGEIHAPVVAAIAQEILQLIKSDATLRRIQGANAPRAYYFDRQTLGAGALANVPYVINEAQSGSMIFSSLAITFDTAAGLGFYRLDGIPASLVTGVEIPAGGGVLVIQGHDNIKGFSMINQAAQALPFARYLYL